MNAEGGGLSPVNVHLEKPVLAGEMRLYDAAPRAARLRLHTLQPLADLFPFCIAFGDGHKVNVMHPELLSPDAARHLQPLTVNADSGFDLAGYLFSFA